MTWISAKPGALAPSTEESVSVSALITVILATASVWSLVCARGEP